MKVKTGVILSFVAIVVLSSILFVGFLLNQFSNTSSIQLGDTIQQEEPKSLEEQIDSKVVEDLQKLLDNQEGVSVERKSEYAYVAITKEDTLALVKENGAKLFVSLENLNWTNIQVSPDYKNFAVLGSTDLGESYNIFVYSFAQNKISRITDFSINTGGITSFAWQTEDTILFTQGEGAFSWVHKLPLSTNSFTKILNIDATLVAATNTHFAIQNTAQNTFDIYTTEFVGLAASLENVSYLDIIQNLAIYIYADDEGDEFLVLEDLESKSKEDLTLPIDILPICFNKNNILGLTLEDGEFYLTQYEWTQQLYQTELINLSEISTTDTSCRQTDSSILLNSRGNIWYRASYSNEGELELSQLEFLDEYRSVVNL